MRFGGITTADAGAVARLNVRGGIPSLGRGCDVTEQLRHRVAFRGVAERSSAASNALRGVLMKPDASSP